MNEKFVPFVVREHSTGNPKEHQWWVDHVKNTLRDGRFPSNPGQGNEPILFTITASGKPVEGGKGSLRETLDFKLKAFAKLAATDRKPLIEDLTAGTAKPRFNLSLRIPPPPGGLVLTTYSRWLHRDEQGRYGRLEMPVGKYRVTDFGQTWCPFINIYATPMVSWMWLSEQEWKALVPADPKQDDTISIPRALRLRLLLMHLTWLGRAGHWSPEAIRSDDLVLRVDQVSPREVRMRLQGSLLLIHEASGAFPYWANPKDIVIGQVTGEQQNLPEKYHHRALDARLEGILIYDRQAKKFSRFDLVGLGDTWGVGLGGLMYTRWPVGFTFELDMSDYEKGFSRGTPYPMIFAKPAAYWNPDVLSKGYQAKAPFYTYPE